MTLFHTNLVPTRNETVEKVREFPICSELQSLSYRFFVDRRRVGDPKNTFSTASNVFDAARSCKVSRRDSALLNLYPPVVVE